MPYDTTAVTISTTPNAVDESSVNDGTPISTRPITPTAMPMSCHRPGALRNAIEAISATNTGMAPFSMPARLDEMCCCASGNSVIGKASHVMPTAAMRGQSARSTVTRDDRTMLRVR